MSSIANSAFFAIGTWEWVVIGGIAVLMFGAAKLPKLARSVGQSVVEFKKGIKSDELDALDSGEGDGKKPSEN